VFGVQLPAPDPRCGGVAGKVEGFAEDGLGGCGKAWIEKVRIRARPFSRAGNPEQTGTEIPRFDQADKSTKE
jgi:hypothetical protein